MTDIDPRVQRALENLPEGDPAARARARQSALDALPLTRRAHRPRWRFAIAASVGAVLLAGTALAATDRLDLRLGKPTLAKPAVVAEQPFGQVTVPNGAEGLAVVAGGRLWLKTAGGLGVQGLAVTTAELSPNALYVAVGIDDSLVAMAPDGRRAWTHDAGGRVTEVAWAPNPIVVAYIVRRGARHELRVIEGNGDNDRLVDADVGDARPSWRADTLALAYVGADGLARVVNYPSLAATPVAKTSPAAVAYAPVGDLLAQEGRGPRLRIRAATPTTGFDLELGVRIEKLVGLVWAAPDTLVVVGDEGPQTRLWAFSTTPVLYAKSTGSRFLPTIDAVSASPTPRRLAVGVPVGAQRQVWEVAVPEPGSDQRLTPERVLLRLPASTGPIEVLSIR